MDEFEKGDCSWCKKDDAELMVSGVMIPMVCNECGGGLGWATYKQINETIKELTQEITILKEAQGWALSELNKLQEKYNRRCENDRYSRNR